MTQMGLDVCSAGEHLSVGVKWGASSFRMAAVTIVDVA